MATKTLGNLLTTVRHLLDTTTGSGGTWGDELVDYANAAQYELVALLLPTQLDGTLVKRNSTSKVSATLPVSGIWEIPRAGDHYRPVALYKTGGIIIEPLPDPSDLYRRRSTCNYTATAAGTVFYALQGGTYLIWPAEQTTYTEVYVAVPAEMAESTDKISVPDQYFHVLAEMTAALALRQVGRLAQADRCMAIAQSSIKAMRDVWTFEPPKPYIDVPEKR